jgi:hypothetical protein
LAVRRRDLPLTDLKMAILLQPCGFGGSAQRTQPSTSRPLPHDVRPGLHAGVAWRMIRRRDGRIGRSRRLTRGRLWSGDHRRSSWWRPRRPCGEDRTSPCGLHDVLSGRLSAGSASTSRYQNDRQNQRPSHGSSSRAKTPW